MEISILECWMGPDVRVGFLEGMAPELRNGAQKGVSRGDIETMQRPRNKKEHNLFNALRGIKNAWRMVVSKG